jgi:hypothetical protein
MKVFVNGQVISAEDTPIVIVLDDADKANIASMPRDHYRYGCFSDKLTLEECRKIMLRLTEIIGPPSQVTLSGDGANQKAVVSIKNSQ